MAASNALYGRLLRSLESIETVDTHEHILVEKDRLSQHVDFLHSEATTRTTM